MNYKDFLKLLGKKETQKEKDDAFKKWQELNKPKPPKDGPQLGDWVICAKQAERIKDKPDLFNGEEIYTYINYMGKNLGKIINIKKQGNWYYEILYRHFPEELGGFFNPMLFTSDNIDFHSSNKKEAEEKLNMLIISNKYNI